MKTLCGWAVGLVWLATTLVGAEESGSFFRDLAFDAALKQAGVAGKMVFGDFYKISSEPCKTLDSTTWKDPRVVALLRERTVPLKIDAEKEPDLAKRYEITTYPTMLLLTPDGTVIYRLVGYRTADRFIADFSAALEGKTSLVRAQEAVAKGGGKDPMKRRQLGKELALQGRYAEALTEYLWCYDEGFLQDRLGPPRSIFGSDGERLPEVASANPVRLSFLLLDIANLGRNYPPAMEALRQRREKAWVDFSGVGRDAREALMEVIALNRALGESRRNLEIYDKLSIGDPLRRVMSYDVFDLLLEARRYADAVEAKPLRSFINEMKMVDRIATEHKRSAEFIRAQKLSFLRPGANELEALAGADQLKDARTLLSTLLAIDGSDETRTLLREHLARVGHPELLPADASAATVEPKT